MLFSAAASALSADTDRQFFDDETQPLMVGEQQVDSFPSSSAMPLKRGVAVIFYESGSIGLTFDVAAQIAMRLNGLGWDTLLVPAMLTPPSDLPAGSDEGAGSAQQETVALPPAYDYAGSRATFRMLYGAVTQHIADKKGFRMVLAQGMTAALLLDTGSKDAITLPDTAVVVSPFWPQRDHNLAVAEHLATTTFPVLDIGLNDYNHWSLATRQQRSQRAQTALKLHYRQQIMLSLGTSAIAGTVRYSGRHPGVASLSTATSAVRMSVSPFANRLTNRVYGWTTYLGW